MARPVVAPCKIPMWLKGGSSKWIHDEFANLSTFGWQDGYGIFSVSKSQVPDVIRYIENQEEHHKKVSFQDEYRAFLNAYKIEFDERYIWD